MTSETLLPPPDAIKTKASTSFYNSGSNKTTLLSSVAFSALRSRGDEYAHVRFDQAATGETTNN